MIEKDTGKVIQYVSEGGIKNSKMKKTINYVQKTKREIMGMKNCMKKKIIQWRTGRREDVEKATMTTRERTNDRTKLKTKKIAHTFRTSWTFLRTLHAQELLR